jgi:antitoxin component of MazEF toxin-antitoxin module
VGNKLGVRIPAAVAREVRPRVNQRVRVSIDDGRIINTPQADKALRLADRLAARAATKAGLPDRQDIVWIECQLQAGNEYATCSQCWCSRRKLSTRAPGLSSGRP